MSVGEIQKYLNVDSLAYLELDRVKAASGVANAGFCDACFTGNYPVEVPLTLSKGMLERNPTPRVDAGSATLTLLFDTDVPMPASEARDGNQSDQHPPLSGPSAPPEPVS